MANGKYSEKQQEKKNWGHLGIKEWRMTAKTRDFDFIIFFFFRLKIFYYFV